MGKEGSAKTDAMRKAREEQWAAQQAAARKRPVPQEPPSGVGSLDNDGPSEPHRVSRPSTDKEIAASDNRVIREAHAQAAPALSKHAKAAAAIEAAAKGRELGENEGRCVACGKVRALRNGKTTAHQKGLGKACPGSGKAPA